MHLLATLSDQRPSDGDRRRITQCTINPELRNGIANRQLVTPGQRYDMAPPCFAMAHHLREGHRLVLRVTTSDPDKVPLFSEDPEITEFTGVDATGIDLPVVADPVLQPDDVPLEEGGEAPPTGPARAPIEGSMTPAAPGASVRQDGVTSAMFELDALEGADNARLSVLATPAAPSDMDLYLQRQNADGTWSDDLAVGARRPPSPRRRSSAASSPGSTGSTSTTGRVRPAPRWR